MKKRQWFTVLKEKKPGLIVILAIVLLNVLFWFVFSLAVSILGEMSYPEAMFHCLTMLIDPGSLSDVVDGKGGLVLCLICFVIVIFGLIAFTGAVIGYVSNFISGFIDAANNGKNMLKLEGHTVILNWNDRALEIINEYFLLQEKCIVVVLTAKDRDRIQKLIDDHLAISMRGKGFKNYLTVIIRTGNVYSSKQLLDVSISTAKSVVILQEDVDDNPLTDDGGGQTIKTLMQVLDIVSKREVKNRQKIVVESNDKWTQDVMSEVLSCKKDESVEVIGVPVNQLFGNIFTQFAVMPQLNKMYNELFSNEGVEFYSVKSNVKSEVEFIEKHLKTHSLGIPLTVREYKGEKYEFFLANKESDLNSRAQTEPKFYEIKLKKDYLMRERHIIILGHNKNLVNILNGLELYNNEWKKDGDVIKVLLMDDGSYISNKTDFKKYSFIEDCIDVNINQKDKISQELNKHLEEIDTTILILSDDSAEDEQKDLQALTNLIYLQSALNKKASENFDVSKVDIVVEILEPKHHDIVQNYSKSNIVISNRYVSKIMTQLADKEALFDFYTDILTFDSNGEEGKEIYIKKVDDYFAVIPEKMPIRDFVYSLYIATMKEKGVGEVVMGWVDESDTIHFFANNLVENYIQLTEKCKLIIFSNH